MKKKNGNFYKTIEDASKELGVSIATVRRYIKSGIFPPPSREFFGSQSYAIFSDSYLQKAKAKLNQLRSQ